jgi:hypothetical protein
MGHIREDKPETRIFPPAVRFNKGTPFTCDGFMLTKDYGFFMNVTYLNQKIVPSKIS